MLISLMEMQEIFEYRTHPTLHSRKDKSRISFSKISKSRSKIESKQFCDARICQISGDSPETLRKRHFHTRELGENTVS